MNFKLEGTITVKNINGHATMVGFTWNDWKMLCRISRNRYKLKTKNKRILKRYVRKLINEALREAIKEHEG